MQLPDCCLGRRFPVFVALETVTDETHWDISELALPDRTIVHELAIVASGAYGMEGTVRLALGDQLPTTTAQMDSLEPLFHGFGLQGPGPRYSNFSMPMNFAFRRLKMYVPAQGRRIILEAFTASAQGPSFYAAIIVSSIPTEVPEWLI